MTSTATPGTPLLQMRGITKTFPGVVANDSVDFDVRRGEVHALLGENGAGKSTLMKILFGLQHADSGEVLLDGEPLRLRSPADAIAAGVGMIHQHFMLVPTLTVAENVALGGDPTGRRRRNPLAGRASPPSPHAWRSSAPPTRWTSIRGRTSGSCRSASASASRSSRCCTG